VGECKSEFDRRDVSIAVVSFAEPSKLARYQELHRWPFTMLADPDRSSYQGFDLKRFSIFRVFSPATLKRYLQLIFKGMKQEPYGGEDIFQSGGDFLVDRKGNLLFAYRSRDPADRPAPVKLLEEIDQIKSRTAE
jgi:peroxiredoxin